MCGFVCNGVFVMHLASCGRRARQPKVGLVACPDAFLMEESVPEGWVALDREAATLETLELAIELHEGGRTPAVVMAVAHAGWQYVFFHARKNKKGRQADLELVEVLREALGHGFDPTWARQRATELAEDLRRYEARKGTPPKLRVRKWTPVFTVLCAIADCRTALGRATPAMDAWRDRQTTLALQECIASPDVLARIEAIRTAARRDPSSHT